MIHVRAEKFVRSTRCRAEAWLVHCGDDEYYVVKFPDNPQHVRILANEGLAGRLARLLGIPVATPASVEISPQIAMERSTTREEFDRPAPCWAARLAFGSRHPGSRDQTLVVDFLPDRSLSKVQNLSDLFLGDLEFPR
jgi:hypothetical protein